MATNITNELSSFRPGAESFVGQRAVAVSAKIKKTAFIEVLLDLVAVNVSLIAANIMYRTLGLGKHVRYPHADFLLISLAISIVFVLCLAYERGYKPGASLLGVRESERVLKSVWNTYL